MGFITLSRTGVCVWGLGILFLLVWVFALGVMVGRGTIFQNEFFKNIVAKLPGDQTQIQPPAVEVVVDSPDGPAPETGISESELTFYDTLPQVKSETMPGPEPETEAESNGAEAEEPPAAETKPPSPAAGHEPAGESASRSPNPNRAAGSPPEETSRVKREAAENTSTRSNTEPARPAPSTGQSPRTAPPARSDTPRPTTGGRNYTIQVAAAPNVAQAEKEAAQLRKQGYDAYYYQVEFKGRKYYRIRVGRFTTRDQAQNTLNNLNKTGRQGMFISDLSN